MCVRRSKHAMCLQCCPRTGMLSLLRDMGSLRLTEQDRSRQSSSSSPLFWEKHVCTKATACSKLIRESKRRCLIALNWSFWLKLFVAKSNKHTKLEAGGPPTAARAEAAEGGAIAAAVEEAVVIVVVVGVVVVGVVVITAVAVTSLLFVSEEEEEEEVEVEEEVVVEEGGGRLLFLCFLCACAAWEVVSARIKGPANCEGEISGAFSRGQ